MIEYRLTVSERALRDRDLAVSWYASNFSTSFANRWYRGLLKAVDAIRKTPSRYPLAKESHGRSLDIREYLYHASAQQIYRILFTVDDRHITVLHIWHSSRDQPPLDSD